MRELERDIPDEAAPDADAEALPHLVVLGPGRAGRSIARAARLAGLGTEIAGRDRSLDACRRAEIALLCVPDAAIAGLGATVAAAVPPLRFVGHVSGATGLDALSPARDRGAELFSLHPLQTLPDGDSELRGAPCAVSGSSAAALRLAERLAERLGMRPFALAEEQRAAYHAAASIASNLLVALEESAAELLEKAGVDDGRQLLAPLVRHTVVNWAERGPEALTGPIARGDAETVERHEAALREVAPELLPMYEALAERARELASSRQGAAA
jgi:predicted short-subunit dehydrogenase-like oxidoreductase (DUF2520 family)